MLILKQNAANSVPTPPSGKGTIFLDDSDTLSVKVSDGNVQTFPTVGASNAQVVFMDGTTLTGENAFTYDFNTNILTVTGNVAAGNVLTDNLYYANGLPWDLQEAAGSNNQIQYNIGNNFAASANFTYNDSTQLFTVAGNAQFNNANAGNLLTANFVSGTLTTASQPNITSVGSLTTLAVSGNAVINGNLTVNGNVTYVNVDTLQIEDPVIALGGGPNGAPLTSNDGKDRGTLLHYYTTSAIDAFMGWDNSNGEFAFGSNVSVTNDVVSFTSLGNVRVGNIIGNGQALTGLAGANVSGQVANALVAGTVYTNAQPNITSVGTLTSLAVTGNLSAGNVSGTLLTGTLTTAAQPNITSVGKLQKLLMGSTANALDFPNAIAISSQDDTGLTGNENIGLVGEGVGNGVESIGVLGAARANGAQKATGVQGSATVTNTGDTGAAVGVRGYATTTHAGGFNIGVLGNAMGSGVGNYAFYVQNGGIGSIENNTFWDLNDDSAAALAFNSSGKANILAISTIDGNEGVTMSGTLSVTGNISAGGVKTDNLYYANGTAWDLQEAAGSNNQIQFNISNNFAASANLTYNDSTQLFTVVGNGAFNNVNAGNLLTANFVSGTLTTASQPNITSVGTLSSLSVTGNVDANNVNATASVTAGNVYANSGTVGASLLTGTLTTASQPNVTSLGTLSSLDVSGNVTAGNIYANSGAIGASLLTGTLTTASQPNITSVGTLSSLTVTGNASAGNLSTGGALSVVGNANVGNLGATGVVATTLGGTLTTASQPNVTSLGTLTGLDVNGNIIAANITANTGVFTGNGSGLSALAGANVTGTVANATHASTANTVVDAAQPNITSVGTLTSLAVTGNASAGNLSTSGTLSVTGNANVGNIGATGVVATTLGGTLTTAAQPNITSVGTLTSLGVNGTVTAVAFTANTGVFTGNGSGLTALAGANVTGQVGNALVAGTVYTNAQPNITSVGTLSSLAVTGNATAGNVYANSGTVGASLLTGTLTTAAQPNITSVGTLSSLSVTGNVAAGNLTTTGILSVTGTGTSSIAGNLDMTSNNITNLAEPVNSTDAATKAYVDSVAEGLHTHDSCNAATDGTLATISGGTVTYNNGTSGVGATLTTTGSYTTIDGVTLSDGMRILVKNEANAAHNGIYTRTSSTVLTRATDFDTPSEMAGGDFTFVTAGTLYDNTGWVMTDAVTTVGTSAVNWTQFSGAGTYTAGTGLTLTGSQFSVNASQTQITAVGTLTGLNVNGNIVAANITANTGVFTGNGSGLSALAGANVTGQVGNALVAGTVYTAAQPNITSVGTLTSLSVTGNVSAGNVSGTLLTGTLTTASQPNVTSLGTLTGLGVNGNITAANITANTGVFTGNGSGLTALAGANVTGQVGNALVAGTVYTAAQPNITSVGTLTSLAVTGNASAGNLSTGGTLSVTGNANVGNIGAAAGVFTSVSGNGAALTALNASNISTGTLAQARLANSNVVLGNTTLTLGSTVTTVTGLSSVTSTTFVGALTGAATTAGTVTTAAQPNITSVGTLTSLAVTGNASAGNISTGGALSVTGNANVGNIGAAAGVFTSVSGNGAALTALNASNLASGTVPSARLSGTYTITVSGSATTAGTVTTAAQPNITSVGTLTSLAVTGNVSAGNLTSTGTVGGTGATHLGNVLTTGANTTAGTVTGNWTLSAGSRWNATYADLAEKYVADADYEPGTVLVFGGEFEVTQANEFDSTRVAGVVSTEPAYVMNAACEGEHVATIALQGRVPVKVLGQVRKGDLMVSAGNGHAKANNEARAGSIIGKALENFDGESGVIEVVIGRV